MNRFEQELFLNQISQGVRSLQDGISYLESLPQEERNSLFSSLCYFIGQAHPIDSEVNEAIIESGLKPTYTPCVLIKKGPLNQQLAKIRLLPENEHEKALTLLIHILKIADHRRKQLCGAKCHHWWHRDLGNPNVVKEIKNDLCR